MSYATALEVAGAVVLDFERFGDYQGSWYAKVQVGTEKFYVAGSYGSCSGCDAFEHEFDFSDHDHEGGEYISAYCLKNLTPDTCTACEELQKALVEFGQSYLSDPRTWESLWKYQEENSSWDSEAKNVMNWLEKVKEM